ncbi:MAG: PRTRC system ThiF family protein [Legionellaceae bacterium]|nr:PRTRC system ThiF family protein [Legionellaceae bacterium]
MRVHFPPSYFTNPPHPISVHLIGCGGTGSQVLNGLARINHTMKALDHPGLHITAFDPDTVSETNIGRQLFSPIDINQNKATVLVTRVNNFYGTGWISRPQTYTEYIKQQGKSAPYDLANIIITCVDTIAARRELDGVLIEAERDYTKPYYWMDFGNSHRSGQVILGTAGNVKQPESKFETVGQLPNLWEQFPELKGSKEADQGPSCSLAQALGRQDLFINSALAQLGCGLLWKLLSDVKIDVRGFFLNLETMNVNPIKI